jgi:hypothetical protein
MSVFRRSPEKRLFPAGTTIPQPVLRCLTRAFIALGSIVFLVSLAVVIIDYIYGRGVVSTGQRPQPMRPRWEQERSFQGAYCPVPAS